MKRTALLVLAVLALASCTKKKQGGGAAEQPELRLTSRIEAATRGDVQSTQIVSGETVWAWVSDAPSSDALYNAVELTAGTNGALTGGTAMYFPPSGNDVRIAAVHGMLEQPPVAGTTALPSSFDFTVAADQSGGDEPYVRSDLLYAAQTASPKADAVSLKFYHMLSKLELVIKKGPEVTDEITHVTLVDVALGGRFTPGADAELAQQAGRAAMIAGDGARGTMTLGSRPAGDDEENPQTNDAIVVPQPVAGKTMVFTLASGGTLVHTIPEGKAFESGKRHLYTVTLHLTGVTVESSIEPWDDADPVEGDATLPGPAKIGDFFYSDGSYSTEYNPAKTAIGIVFQTDPARIGQAEKDALAAKGITEPHGLVMSLKDVASRVLWSMENIDFPELPNCETKNTCAADIDGLHHWNTIMAYAKQNDKLSIYPAFETLENLPVKAPANTTGWYIPSVGQSYDFFANLGGLPGWDQAKQTAPGTIIWEGVAEEVLNKINAYLLPLGTNEKFTYDSFWSSSEYCYDMVKYMSVSTYGDVSCSKNYKYGEMDLRPILAF